MGSKWGEVVPLRSLTPPAAGGTAHQRDRVFMAAAWLPCTGSSAHRWLLTSSSGGVQLITCPPDAIQWAPLARPVSCQLGHAALPELLPCMQNCQVMPAGRAAWPPQRSEPSLVSLSGSRRDAGAVLAWKLPVDIQAPVPSPVRVKSGISRTIFTLTVLPAPAAAQCIGPAEDAGQELHVAATCLDRQVHWLALPATGGEPHWKDCKVRGSSWRSWL